MIFNEEYDNILSQKSGKVVKRFLTEQKVRQQAISGMRITGSRKFLCCVTTEIFMATAIYFKPVLAVWKVLKNVLTSPS